MQSPFTGKEMIVQKDWRTMSFRKEEFKICFHAWRCEDTNEQFEDEAFAQLNYNQVQNQYRTKYSIPFVTEIKTIREQYGLSASKMSEVLGFGANSYRQYEAGEIPSQSNARLIQLSSDPHEFRKLVAFSNVLEGTTLEKTVHKIEHIIQSLKSEKQKLVIEAYLMGVIAPNTMTGYRKPDFDKMAEMVLFFSETMKPWKTKLNKLLFYSDFTHFKQTGFSISGSVYNAITMGPVPNNFQGIYEFLSNQDIVEIHCTSFPDGGLGEQFSAAPNRKFNATLFTETEMTVLNEIANRFKETSTQNMIDISHKENAWTANVENKNPIDYLYAFDLK